MRKRDLTRTSYNSRTPMPGIYSLLWKGHLQFTRRTGRMITADNVTCKPGGCGADVGSGAEKAPEKCGFYNTPAVAPSTYIPLARAGQPVAVLMSMQPTRKP